jgi:hypothetical protein
MSPEEVQEAVARGIQYLDNLYPGWWHKVDLTTLNICSSEHHILAQITGKLGSETPELLEWALPTLRLFGFRTELDYASCDALNAEWTFRVRHIKDERK